MGTLPVLLGDDEVGAIVDSEDTDDRDELEMDKAVSPKSASVAKKSSDDELG